MLQLSNPDNVLAFQIDGTAETYEIPRPAALGVAYSRRLQGLAKGTDRETAAAFIDLMVDVLNQYAPGAAERMSIDALLTLAHEWSGEGLGE